MRFLSQVRGGVVAKEYPGAEKSADYPTVRVRRLFLIAEVDTVVEVIEHPSGRLEMTGSLQGTVLVRKSGILWSRDEPLVEAKSNTTTTE